MEEAITPGQNGLPQIKDNYSPEEKAIIVSKAAEVGTRVVAKVYGLDWHHIASWKRFYGKESGNMSKNKNVKKNSKSTTKNIKDVKNTAVANTTPATVPTITTVSMTMSESMPAIMSLIIQSPSGQEITPEEIRNKIASVAGNVARVYIRADEGKAYWVRGEEEHGSVDLW